MLAPNRRVADSESPAFYNCELRGGHESIGSVIYTNNSGPYFDNAPYDGLVTTTECLPPWTGHPRGTFGSYCDWEPDIADTATNWSAVLFLVGAPSAFNPVEICPETSRVADVAIRRPQHFKPGTGAWVTWELRDAGSHLLLQTGADPVGADGLVTIPNLRIPRDPSRARLTVFRPSPSTPCVTPPVLYSRLLTHGLLELRWEACPDLNYELESSVTLSDWQSAGPPGSAPLGGGWLTNRLTADLPHYFLRVRAEAPSADGVPRLLPK